MAATIQEVMWQMLNDGDVLSYKSNISWKFNFNREKTLWKGVLKASTFSEELLKMIHQCSARPSNDYDLHCIISDFWRKIQICIVLMNIKAKL